jgi:hypothetical protein
VRILQRERGAANRFDQATSPHLAPFHVVAATIFMAGDRHISGLFLFDETVESLRKITSGSNAKVSFLLARPETDR